MNNTSKSNSKAKLIAIIAGLLLVIVIAFIFILKLHQNKDNEVIENNTKQHEHYEQQNVDKDIKTSVKDSTYGEAIPEEADQNSENIESAGDMNGDTSEGVEISEELKNYNESPESQVTEEDNIAEWSEEPKQEEVYVPDNTPQVNDTPEPATTPEPAPAPEDNSNSNSGSDDSFWGGSDTNQDINWDSNSYGDDGWKPAGGWHY